MAAIELASSVAAFLLDLFTRPGKSQNQLSLFILPSGSPRRTGTSKQAK